MSRLLLVVLSFAIVVSATTTVPSFNGDDDVVENEFIVMFRPGVDANARATRMTRALTKLADGQSRVKKVWSFESFAAYHVYLLPGTAQDLLVEEAADVDTISVEPNRRVHAIQSCSLQKNAEWNLQRVTVEGGVEGFDFDGRFSQPEGSTTVNAYIVDTGIYVEHDDFKGRVEWGGNFADTTNTDCNGHGTHVAGTVAGTLYGVSKTAHLIAVKVLSCDGSGTNAGVIDGVQFVADEHKKRKAPSTANMSLGGGLSTALNGAVAAAVKAGVTFVVAAGNENTDACKRSPASEKSAISVGATALASSTGKQEDARASFSNYGSCVSIFAPGQAIKSAWIGGTSKVNTISGTSMAAPHVCGAAAVYLSQHPDASPADVSVALESASTKGVVNLACSASAGKTCTDTTNSMLYSAACDK